MKENKSKYRTVLAVALALFVISPLDDVIISVLFGTALFGFGSIPFYILVCASSAISIIFWKRHLKHKGERGGESLPSISNPTVKEQL